MTSVDFDGLAADALRHTSGLQVVIDRDGRILVANDNWKRLAAAFDGEPTACGEGANYFDVCRRAAAEGESVAQQVLDACRAALADGMPRLIEYACAPPQALTGPPAFWYRLYITRMSHEHLLLEHADVTDEQIILRRAREAASQAAFERLVLKAVAQPVIATDLEGTVSYWNEAAEAFFGYRGDEALGRPITEVTVPETSVEQAAEIMATLSRGESWTGEFWVRHRDGTRFPARVTDIPMQDANGNVIGIVGVSEDLRPYYAQQAEQQRLRNLENQLRQSQKLEALGTVAGGVAHEFNNVLAAILGHAELLRDSPEGSPECQQAAEDIVAATRRGRDVVYSLLAFARPQSGDQTPIDAAEWFRSAVRLIEPIIPRGVRVISTFEATATTLLANQTHLTQILLNLASNAGYAMRDTPRRELRIRGAREAVGSNGVAASGSRAGREWFVLEVADTGTGMDQAALDRVFDPFFTTKPIGDGTGLGLAVVHGLVHAHDGSITISSTPGVGTTVLVRLPVTDTGAVATAQPTAPARFVEAPAVLLVDDDPMVLRALTRMLERAGVRVTAFTDPKAAAVAIETAGDVLPWNAAIFDYSMPGLRGDELAWMLTHAGRTLPVVLCSGNIGDLEAPPPVVREVLEKPVGSDELIGSLRRVLAADSPG